MKLNKCEKFIINTKNCLTCEQSPTVENFRLKYFLTKMPVVIENQMEHWPAMKKWNIEYIKKSIGKRTVPIEIGNKYTDTKWSQQLMTIEHFINRFLRKQTKNVQQMAYLAQHPLFNQVNWLFLLVNRNFIFFFNLNIFYLQIIKKNRLRCTLKHFGQLDIWYFITILFLCTEIFIPNKFNLRMRTPTPKPKTSHIFLCEKHI